MAAVTSVNPKMGNRRPQVNGTQLEWRGTVNMAASYATGGDTVSAKSLGMTRIEGAIVGSAGGYTFEGIVAAPDLLIKAYRLKDPAAAGGADIPEPQVAAAVDLSAIAPSIIIWGY